MRKHILFWFWLVVISLPALNGFFNIVREKKLKGAVEEVSYKQWTWSGWWGGDWQKSTEKYLSNNYGFHTSSIRLFNQLDYSLFNELHAKSTILGKNGYLFEDGYIKGYLGLNVMSDNDLREHFQQLKCIQHGLEAEGKHFLLIIAPGKASFYPDYFPAPYDRTPKQTNNYEKALGYLAEMGINTLNFREYFYQRRDSFDYPIFTPYGTHWSNYAAILAMDSVIHYTEKMLQKPLRHLHIDKISMRRDCPHPDCDIGAGLNLIYPISNAELPFPIIHLDTTHYPDSPRALVIGDSFYWQWHNLRLSEHILNNAPFWFYNGSVFYKGAKEGESAKDKDLNKELADKDVVIIMCNESNIHLSGWGFPDKYCNILKRQSVDSLWMEQQIQAEIEAIKKDSAWMNGIKRNLAGQPDSSIINSIRDNAEWKVLKGIRYGQ